ncbi:MAG: N,N-dimethylformamidase beta subunit family domain-containing protein, partial [Actinomycetes bacterium]
MEPVSRRTALVAGAATLLCGGLSACGPSGPSGRDAGAGSTSTAGPSSTGAVTTTTTDPAGWVLRENARPGTPGWEVPSDPRVGQVVWERVRGYASATSVDRGGTFDLFVSTAAPEWRVEAYRVGWYGGVGARKVWESAPQRGGVQAAAVRLGATNTWVAPWQVSLEVVADREWPPGMYLLKLVSSDGGQSYVPLVVRDDRSTAAVGIQSSVTTWQAYNQWGGANLYQGLPGRGGRSDVVSFDRPYYRRGSGEFFGREYEFVLFAERHGYDVTYWTDVDLHADPARAARHRVVVSLGHDEYYSTEMRRGLEGARDAGTNLLFLGANGCFRKIRLEDS